MTLNYMKKLILVQEIQGNTQIFSVLFYFILFYFILFYFILFYFILLYFIALNLFCHLILMVLNSIKHLCYLNLCLLYFKLLVWDAYASEEKVQGWVKTGKVMHGGFIGLVGKSGW